jgi:hypothetical protein
MDADAAASGERPAPLAAFDDLAYELRYFAPDEPDDDTLVSREEAVRLIQEALSRSS